MFTDLAYIADRLELMTEKFDRLDKTMVKILHELQKQTKLLEDLQEPEWVGGPH